MGGSVSEHEVRLFGFPARFGGLGISDPVKFADLAFSSSREGSSILVDAIHGVTEFSLTAHLDLLARVRNDISRRREVDVQSALSSLLDLLPSPVCRTVRRAVDFQTSGWLTVLPLACHQFDLSTHQFHDALSLQYHRPLSMMPSSCGGCGSAFSLSHALDCHKGGQRHNEVRDALGDLAALAYKDVIREPVVCEGNAEVSALVADLGIRGVWLPQTEALLDIRVTDADAPSFCLTLLVVYWLWLRRKRSESMYLLLKPIMDLSLLLL